MRRQEPHLPGQVAPEEVHEHVAQRLQVIPPGEGVRWQIRCQAGQVVIRWTGDGKVARWLPCGEQVARWWSGGCQVAHLLCSLPR